MIEFARDLSLPPNAVTQTFAFLARRGAGKTYGAQKLCEGMIQAGAQVVVLDCIGNWWGLRVAANGKDPGLQIPIFGGDHADVALNPTSGALVASVVVERSISVVLDVSAMRKGEQKRFAKEFAEELYHRKRGARSPLHFFIEEAQRFVPQRCGPDDAPMLGAFEDIVKLGRNYGIGATLISQRPQAVAKEALSQTECLVVLQTNEAQARKAIEEWIVEQGLDVKSLVRELPGLELGEAFVWSPSWLRCTKKVRILKKTTLGASSTPELGAKAHVARTLAPVDLKKIGEAMAASVEQTKRDDPKALRARIAELERDLKKAGTAEKIVTREIPVPVLSNEDRSTMETLAARLQRIAETNWNRGGLVPSRPEPRASQKSLAAAIRQTGDDADIVRAGIEADREALANANGASLGRGPLRILWAAGAFDRNNPPTRSQIALQVGMTATGGSFLRYLSTLRSAGMLVDERQGHLVLSDAAWKMLGGRQSPAISHTDVCALWFPKLGAGPRKILQVLIDEYPSPMSRVSLGAAVEMEPLGGSFQRYLSTLSSAGLIARVSGGLAASTYLFPGGRNGQ